MTETPAPSRFALAVNAVAPVLNAAGHWLPLSVREAVALAVLTAADQATATPTPGAARTTTSDGAGEVPLRGELPPWSLLASEPDPSPATEDLRGGRRLPAPAPEPDDTDLTEADVDRMMADGIPVQIVNGPPPTHAVPPHSCSWCPDSGPSGCKFANWHAEIDRQRATARIAPDPCSGCRYVPCANCAPAPEPGLREQVAALFRCPPGGVRLGDEPPGIIADAVLAVRDRRMEQLAAGRETWKRKALEMEADRDRLLALLGEAVDWIPEGELRDRICAALNGREGAPLLAYALAGLDEPPNPDDALCYARVLAERGGTTLPGNATATVTQQDGGKYRVDITATKQDPS